MTNAQTNATATYCFTKSCRAPFLTVVTPEKVGKKGQGKGAPIYGATLLIPPESADLKALKAIMAKVARETWPGRDLKELKFPFLNGDAEAEAAAKNGKDGSFFKGMVVFKASSDEAHPPLLSVRDAGGVRDLLGAQHDVEGKKIFYNGCYVVLNLFIKSYRSQKEGGVGEFSGVKAYIANVFFDKDGPRIGGSGSGAEMFKAYAGTVTDEDPTGGANADDDIPF